MLQYFVHYKLCLNTNPDGLTYRYYNGNLVSNQLKIRENNTKWYKNYNSIWNADDLV